VSAFTPKTKEPTGALFFKFKNLLVLDSSIFMKGIKIRLHHATRGRE